MSGRFSVKAVGLCWTALIAKVLGFAMALDLVIDLVFSGFHLADHIVPGLICPFFLRMAMFVSRVLHRFFRISPSLLGSAFYLIGDAFVCDALIAYGFANSLLDFACHLIDFAAYLILVHNGYSLVDSCVNG